MVLDEQDAESVVQGGGRHRVGRDRWGGGPEQDDEGDQ